MALKDSVGFLPARELQYRFEALAITLATKPVHWIGFALNGVTQGLAYVSKRTGSYFLQAVIGAFIYKNFQASYLLVKLNHALLSRFQIVTERRLVSLQLRRGALRGEQVEIDLSKDRGDVVKRFEVEHPLKHIGGCLETRRNRHEFRNHINSPVIEHQEPKP